MFLSKVAVLFTLVALTVSAPVEKRANLLTKKTYAQFQVSDGVGGKALEEVDAIFQVCPCHFHPCAPRSPPLTLLCCQVSKIRANLAGVSAADFAILQDARVVSESAEVDPTGFNDAIAKAGGTSSAAGKILQVGLVSVTHVRVVA